MKIIEKKLTELIKAEYNPRKISKNDFEQLKRSLSAFECVEPAVVNSNENRKNIIVGGHQRIEAAKSLNWSTFPCVEVDLDLEKEKELNIRLNKNTGSFDFDILANEFDLNDLLDWGFEDTELAEFADVDITEGLTDEDDVPEAPKEATTKLGDLYVLGKHRLLCGDSTNVDDVEKLMNNKKANIVFTDPPYNLENEDYHTNVYLFTEDAHIFLMHDDKGIVEYLRKSQLEFLRFYVANFGFSSPRGNDPYLNHILISQEKNGKAMSHKNLHDGLGSIIKLEYRFRLKDEKTEHKHQKPIEFIEKFIVHYSEEEAILLDLFGGSGSTLIACEKTKRKCRIMELDPKWCDVIVKRWEDFTGKKAELTTKSAKL